MDKKQTIFTLLVWAAAGVLLVLLAFSVQRAVASGTDVEVNTGAVTAGDTSQVMQGSNSQAFGFAHALGDVDINDCLASTQWGTIIVSAQKVALNKWCAGEVYDARGLYKMGARMRCDIPEIAKFFETNAECLADNTVAPTPIEITASPLIDEHLEEEEDYHQETMERLDQMQVQYEQLAAQKPRTVRAAPKPLLSDKQRAALEEVLNEQD